jgi:hypothetical protein
MLVMSRLKRYRLLAVLGIAALSGCRTIDDLSDRVGLFQVIDGNQQSVQVGTTAPTPLAVRAADESGQAIQGLEVRWVIGSGGGTLSSATSLTDNTGTATVMYTAPAQPGAVTVRASVPRLTLTFNLLVVLTAGT